MPSLRPVSHVRPDQRQARGGQQHEHDPAELGVVDPAVEPSAEPDPLGPTGRLRSTVGRSSRLDICLAILIPPCGVSIVRPASCQSTANPPLQAPSSPPRSVRYTGEAEDRSGWRSRAPVTRTAPRGRSVDRLRSARIPKLAQNRIRYARGPQTLTQDRNSPVSTAPVATHSRSRRRGSPPGKGA